MQEGNHMKIRCKMKVLPTTKQIEDGIWSSETLDSDCGSFTDNFVSLNSHTEPKTKILSQRLTFSTATRLKIGER